MEKVEAMTAGCTLFCIALALNIVPLTLLFLGQWRGLRAAALQVQELHMPASMKAPE